MCLVEIWNLSDYGILPERFQSIEIAGLWQEDMDKDVTIVNGYPLTVLHADLSLMTLTHVVADIIGQSVGDTIDVDRGRSFADDEILERGFLELAHINDLYVLCLTVLEAFDDFLY